jgi:hypothetical protein
VRKLLYWLFFWLDPVFRRFARSKERGPNDTVSAGETIVAVLRADGNRRVIR